MRKITLLTMAAIALVALLAVPLAFAQRRHAMHGDAAGFGGGPILGHLLRARQELGLSDQQVSDIKAVFQNLRQQNEPYRATMRSTMQRVAQTLINNPNDIAAAQALLDQQTDSERAMKANALAAASKALNVLSADQRTRLGTMLEERLSHSAK